jgi:hypothetical protein
MATNNVQQKKSTSWGVIILLLIIFWPVGLFLLYKKITGDKAEALKNSKILNTFGWVFMAFAIIYLFMIITGDAKTEGGSSAVGSLMVAFVFFGGGGAFMIYAAKKMKANAEKFKKYIAIVINNNETSIDNIAAAIPTSYEQATKDLQKMIDNGYFENAYIDVSNREIVLPNKSTVQTHSTSNVQMNSPVNEPQINAVVCRNCGANNKVVEGQVCECEYCGSMLK